MKRIALAGCLSVALTAAVWGVMRVGWYADKQIVDTGVYQRYGDQIAHEHRIPYRDFQLSTPGCAARVCHPLPLGAA